MKYTVEQRYYSSGDVKTYHFHDYSEAMAMYEELHKNCRRDRVIVRDDDGKTLVDTLRRA